MPILAAETPEKRRRSPPAWVLVLLALILALLLGVGTAPLWLRQWVSLGGYWQIGAAAGLYGMDLEPGFHSAEWINHHIWYVRCGNWWWAVSHAPPV